MFVNTEVDRVFVFQTVYSKNRPFTNHCDIIWFEIAAKIMYSLHSSDFPATPVISVCLLRFITILLQYRYCKRGRVFQCLICLLLLIFYLKISRKSPEFNVTKTSRSEV